MIPLTKQEKIVLLTVIAVLLLGSGLDYAFKKCPDLKDITSFIDSERVYTKIDLNKATAEELVALPYIGEKTALRIIQYRQENGAFDSVDALKRLPGIYESSFNKFKPFLKVSKK